MLWGQCINEDFEEGRPGSLIQVPAGRWEIDSLSTLNGKFSLHHAFDNSNAGSDLAGWLTRDFQPSMGRAQWSFSLKYTCDPSSANNWSFFLMSDCSPSEITAGSEISGFALGVNQDSYDDTLRLYKYEKGHITRIISSSVNWQDDIGTDSIVSLTVIRETGGNWVLCTGDTNTGTVIGEAKDTTLFYPGWIILKYDYTSSRDRMLWVDDILLDGVVYRDTVAPVTDTVFFDSGNSLLIVFDEELEEAPSVSNFKLKPGNIVPQTIRVTGDTIHIYFENEQANKKFYSLDVSGVCDMNSNCCDTVLDSILLAYPEWGDIIINEIMADPEPYVGLPEAEYLELYNRSEFDLHGQGFVLKINEDEYQLPVKNISKDEYILVCRSDREKLFTSFEGIVGLNGGFSLNNNNALIILKKADGRVIHGLEYDEGWYKSVLKKEGGWSLEMIDTDYPFSGPGNWEESCNNTGGTPGFENSVKRDNPDAESPRLDNIFPLTGRSLELCFSEPMRVSVLNSESWSVDGNSVNHVSSADPLMKRVIINFRDNFEQGEVYNLGITGNLSDIAGNQLVITDNRFGIPSEAAAGDIVVNEILYDPLPGGAEYIEFYNASAGIIDLSELFFVKINMENPDTGKPCWLSHEARCIMPGDYYVLSPDRLSVKGDFSYCDYSKIYNCSWFPSLPDGGAGLAVYNRKLELADKTYYSDDMHSPILAITSGVSLERIDPSGDGTDPSNWQSAAGTCGYGSPGMENSAAIEHNPAVKNEAMTLSSKSISPDYDGYRDLLRITVNSGSGECLLNVNIFNDQGCRVSSLASNLSASYRSEFIWDGSGDTGQSLPEGIYIVACLITYPGKSPVLCKEVCALVYK